MVIKTEYHSSNCFKVQQRPWTPTKRRGPIAAEYNTPGPAAVSLPTTIGTASHDAVSNRSKSPAFSFGGRHEGKKDNFVPGPGTYNIKGLCHTGRESVQAPTLSGRTKNPAPFKTPAPGAYNPEKSDRTVLGAMPSYSFGLKAKDQKHDITPAPGTYSPEKSDETVLGGAPRYSFGIKVQDHKPDNFPAPGTYSPEKCDDTVLGGTPRYSFGQKVQDHKPDNFPAPGHYSPEKFVAGQTPQFTFGLKIEDQKPFKTPAPGHYSPEKSVVGGTPQFTFGLKIEEQKPYKTPAPNSYSIPSSVGLKKDSYHTHSPSYSMGIKCDDIFPVTGKYSPGPGKYNVPEADAYKSKSPAFTLSSRTTIPGDRTQKPGPGAHSPENIVTKQQRPSYSFGIRHSPHAHNVSPRLH